ncbi:hypothetical protein BH23GEM8_BH23GEM8_21720 [soil metagenome]
MAWAFLVGALFFSIGFFLPIIFAPDANQGPLLGIFITGPLGFIAGLLFGLWRERPGRIAGPLEVLGRAGILTRAGATQWAQPAAALAGVLGMIAGISGLRGGWWARRSGDDRDIRRAHLLRVHGACTCLAMPLIGRHVSTAVGGRRPVGRAGRL